MRPEDISYTIISLGCSKNQSDSELLHGSLLSAGFQFAESAEAADLILVNTCGFIEDAKTESIAVILDAAELCTEGSSEMLGKKRLVVSGCLSQRYFDELKSDMPEIDYLYGVTDANLVRALCGYLHIDLAEAPYQRELLVSSPFEYIKIAEGCSNNCSYCAIPLIRGAHRSVDSDYVVRDAKLALERGAKELVIIAQDIAAYKSGKKDLYSLVEEISSLPGEYWVRLLYCHPDKIDDRIISIFSEIPHVVPYIDVPLQHVDQKILESMNRKGSYERYCDLILGLREKIPGIAVRTTFMVGYPGETDKQFQALMNFVSEVPFDRGGVFRFSPEEDTRAALLGDMVEEKISIERFNILSEALENSFRNQLKKRLGKKLPVLVEEKVSDTEWIGRSLYDAPEVDGLFYLTASGNLLNTIVEASVTEAVEFDLSGVL